MWFFELLHQHLYYHCETVILMFLILFLLILYISVNLWKKKHFNGWMLDCKTVGLEHSCQLFTQIDTPTADKKIISKDWQFPSVHHGCKQKLTTAIKIFRIITKVFYQEKNTGLFWKAPLWFLCKHCLLLLLPHVQLTLAPPPPGKG